MFVDLSAVLAIFLYSVIFLTAIFSFLGFQGNPFFVLEFLRSLVDGNLLEYSVRKRRWIWDEQAIIMMDITDNVLSLLTNKISQLSERVQSTLKVMSCFGFGIHKSVIVLLSATTQYLNIREGLDKLIWDSFMVTVAGDLRPCPIARVCQGGRGSLSTTRL